MIFKAIKRALGRDEGESQITRYLLQRELERNANLQREIGVLRAAFDEICARYVPPSHESEIERILKEKREKWS